MKKPLLIVCIGEHILTQDQMNNVILGFANIKDDFSVVVYNQPKLKSKITLIAEDNIKITEV